MNAVVWPYGTAWEGTEREQMLEPVTILVKLFGGETLCPSELSQDSSAISL